MRIIAIVLARSGSKSFPNKNIAELCGKPLMYYTIEAAKKSECFDEIMVSTDSEEYAEIAKKCGANVPFLRSDEQSSDTASSWDAVREVLEKYSEMGQIFDYVMLLQPTSPLRSSLDIKRAVEMIDDKVCNVVSVTEVEHPTQWCFPLDNSCSLGEFAESPYSQMRRQDLQKNYHENGAIYLVDASKILNKDYNLYSDSCYAYIMPRERSVDIDYEIDFKIVEAIMTYSNMS